MKSKMNIKMLMDCDYYAKKKQDFSEKEWKEIVKNWIELCDLVEKKLFKTGKISKITFNRFWRFGTRIFNFHRDDIMMPNKFNELYGIKPLNMVYINNAFREIQIKLKQREELSK